MDNISRTVSKLRDERDELRASLLSATQATSRVAASEKASAKAAAKKDAALLQAERELEAARQHIAELKAALFVHTSSFEPGSSKPVGHSKHLIYPVSPLSGVRDGRFDTDQLATSSANFSDHVVAELRNENIALLDTVQHQQRLVGQLHHQCEDFRDKSRTTLEISSAAQLKSLALVFAVVFSKYELRCKRNAFGRMLRHCFVERQHISELRLRAELAEKAQRADHVQHAKTATAMALLRLRTHGRMVFAAWKKIVAEQRYANGVVVSLQATKLCCVKHQCLTAWRAVLHRRQDQQRRLGKILDHQLKLAFARWRAHAVSAVNAQLLHTIGLCHSLENTVASQQRIIEELGCNDAMRMALHQWRLTVQNQVAVRRLTNMLSARVQERLIRSSLHIIRNHALRRKVLRNVVTYWCRCNVRAAIVQWKSTTFALNYREDKMQQCIRRCFMTNKLSFLGLQHAFLRWRSNSALRTQKLASLMRIVREYKRRCKARAFGIWSTITVASASRMDSLASMADRMRHARRNNCKRLAFDGWRNMQLQSTGIRRANLHMEFFLRMKRLLAGVRAFAQASRHARAVRVMFAQARVRLCKASLNTWKNSFILSRTGNDQLASAWLVLRHASQVRRHALQEAWQAWRMAHNNTAARRNATLHLARIHAFLVKRQAFARWSSACLRSRRLQLFVIRTHRMLSGSMKRTAFGRWHLHSVQTGASAKLRRAGELQVVATVFHSWLMKHLRLNCNRKINRVLACQLAQESARRLLQQIFNVFRAVIQGKRHNKLLRVLRTTCTDSFLKRRTRSMVQRWLARVAGRKSFVAMQRTAFATLRAWCALHAARTKATECNRVLARAALQRWRLTAHCDGAEQRIIRTCNALCTVTESVLAPNNLDSIIRCCERAYSVCLPLTACKIWVAEPGLDHMWSVSADLSGGSMKVTTPLQAKSLSSFALLGRGAYKTADPAYGCQQRSVGPINMLHFPSADSNTLFDPAIDIAVDLARSTGRRSVNADIFVLEPGAGSAAGHGEEHNQTLRAIVQLASYTEETYTRVEKATIAWVSSQISTALDRVVFGRVQREKHHRASKALLGAKSEIREVRTQMNELQELAARLLSETQDAASAKRTSESRQKELETRLVEIISESEMLHAKLRETQVALQQEKDRSKHLQRTADAHKQRTHVLEDHMSHTESQLRDSQRAVDVMRTALDEITNDATTDLAIRAAQQTALLREEEASTLRKELSESRRACDTLALALHRRSPVNKKGS